MNSDLIDNFDWSNIRVFGGRKASAVTGMPNYIMGYFSTDAQVRARSVLYVEQDVCCQGRLGEAAFYVGAIIVECIKKSPESLNSDIVSLLIEICGGYDHENVVIDFHGVKMDLQLACRAVVRAGLSEYKAAQGRPDLNKSDLDLLILICKPKTVDDDKLEGYE